MVGVDGSSLSHLAGAELGTGSGVELVAPAETSLSPRCSLGPVQSLGNVCMRCPHPLFGDFYPSLSWEPVFPCSASSGAALTGCAGDAAVPGLLQHCSSSAGSRQLPEIKRKSSPFSNVPWCSKAQGPCPAELPRAGISKVGGSGAGRERGCSFAGLSVLSLEGNRIFYPLQKVPAVPGQCAEPCPNQLLCV